MTKNKIILQRSSEAFFFHFWNFKLKSPMKTITRVTYNSYRATRRAISSDGGDTVIFPVWKVGYQNGGDVSVIGARTLFWFGDLFMFWFRLPIRENSKNPPYRNPNHVKPCRGTGRTQNDLRPAAAHDRATGLVRVKSRLRRDIRFLRTIWRQLRRRNSYVPRASGHVGDDQWR